MNGHSRRAALRASLAAALIGSTLLASVPALAAPTVGQAAPNFVAIDSKGQRHRLEDYKGKVVVLEWTNHGCPYVKKHYSSTRLIAGRPGPGKMRSWCSGCSPSWTPCCVRRSC